MHFDQVLTHLMSRLVKRSDRYKNIQLFSVNKIITYVPFRSFYFGMVYVKVIDIHLCSLKSFNILTEKYIFAVVAPPKISYFSSY